MRTWRACLVAEINAFVLREARRVRPRTAETMVCALRALLRFLHVQGWIATPLASGGAVGAAATGGSAARAAGRAGQAVA